MIAAPIMGDTETTAAILSVKIVAITTFCCSKSSNMNGNDSRDRCFCGVTDK